MTKTPNTGGPASLGWGDWNRRPQAQLFTEKISTDPEEKQRCMQIIADKITSSPRGVGSFDEFHPGARFSYGAGDVDSERRLPIDFEVEFPDGSKMNWTMMLRVQ